MRLINTHTLEVISKSDNDIPPYAILSHTWGRDNEEATLQDMLVLFEAAKNDPAVLSTHPIARKPGFIKIQQTAKLAASENRDFMWVDTCCIDKTSSAELSEAINSMFRWYQQAEVCYAFLSDIEDSDLEDSADDDQITQSRWFTRGWTLQELIAPPVVHFYSKNWRFLGRKRPASRSTVPIPSPSGKEPDSPLVSDPDFLSIIERATSIDKDLLDGSLDLNEFGVAMRMKWASRRQTTRVEDRAYSLMGLFGVNIPLLYGEGTNAFIRLQEAILLTTDDQSIFAWKCPTGEGGDKLSGLLANDPRFFQYSGHVKPLPSNTITSSTPLGITSAGLRVAIALFKLSDVAPRQFSASVDSDNLFAGVLDCSPYFWVDGDEGSICKPAVVLLWLGGDQFARFNASTLIHVNATGLQHIDVNSYKEVYVKQNPATLSLPEIYLNDQKLVASTHREYVIVDVWLPQGRWDESTRTVRCKTTSNSGIMCIFRYSLRHRNFQDKHYIDVLVGLHDTLLFRAGPAKIWCYVQRASIGDERQLQAIEPPDNVRLKMEHLSMGVHARISVGSGKHAKHNNFTLELQPFFMPQAIDSALVRTQSSIRHRTMSEDPMWLQDHAIFQLICDWTIATGDSFSDCFPELHETDFQPIRFTRNPVTVVNSEMLFALDNLYLERFYECIALIVKRVAYDRDYVQHHSSQGTLEILSSERSLLNFLDSQSGGPPNWHQPTQGPFPRSFGSTFVTSHAKGGRFQYYPGYLRTSLDDLPPLELNVIHYAVALKYNNALKRLVQLDHDVGARFYKTSGYLTPLHLACILGNYHASETLLRESEVEWATVLSETSHYDHPLSLAVSFVRDQRINSFVSCFKKAVSIAYPNCSSPWIDYTRNPWGETSLHRAAAVDNIEGLQAIIFQLPGNDHDGLDYIDRKGRTPLWHAAASGSFRALSLLLDWGADANARDVHGVSALHAACRAPFNPAGLVKVLLSRGADPNVHIVVDSPLRNAPPILVSPCFYAAMHNGSDTLQTLLGCGVSLDTHQSHGNISPLHIAAANGYLECVKVLRSAGFDAEVLTPYRLLVVIDREAEAVEAGNQERLDRWLEGRLNKKKIGEAKPGRFSRFLRRLGKVQETKAKALSDLEVIEFDLGKIKSGPREIAPRIKEAKLETFPFGEEKTALDLATIGGHHDVMGFLNT